MTVQAPSYGFLAGIQGHPRGFQGSRYSLLVVYRGPRTSRYVHHGGPVQGSDPIRSYIGIRHVTAKNGDTYGAIMVRDSFGDAKASKFGVEPNSRALSAINQAENPSFKALNTQATGLS